MNLSDSGLSTACFLSGAGRAPLVPLARRRGGSAVLRGPALLALIAVVLTGCMHSPVKQPLEKHHGALGPTHRAAPSGNRPGHPTGAGYRLVWRSSPDGSLEALYKLPGEYLWLGDIPYRYQGESLLTWEIRNHVVWVNGKEAGLDLSGLDVKTAVALVTQHQTTQTVIYHRADAVPEPLVAALAATPGRRLALSLSGYRGSSKDLAHVASRLAGKIVFLSLSEANVGNGAMPHLARLTNLRVLDLEGTKVSDTGGWRTSPK